MRFLTDHDIVVAQRDKHIVVNIGGHTRQIRKVRSLEFVVHLHQEFHGQRIEKPIQEIFFGKDHPEVGHVHEDVESEFLKGIEHDNVRCRWNHFLAMGPVDNVIPKKERFDKVKHGDAGHQDFLFRRRRIRARAAIVRPHLMRQDGGVHEPLRHKDQQRQRHEQTANV